jgi:nitrite reductase/ring-hydroxylating ferredoxin subunit
MKILKLEVGKIAYVKDIDEKDSLSAMQSEVNGLIAPIFLDDGAVMVVNDECLINGSELNRAVKDEDGKIVAIAAGDCFICGDNGEDFISLTEEQIVKYMEQFKYPEIFVKMNGAIMSFPDKPIEQSFDLADEILDF